jgi:hypothetical protein
MGKNPNVARQGDSVEVAHWPSGSEEGVLVSRAKATDRVFRGGTLAVIGFAGALLVDLANLGPGLPLWGSLAVTLTAFGAGAVWAGSGCSHLIRHGRTGSSLWLISLAGLGGSVILNVVSRILMGVWGPPIPDGLNLFAMASGGLFTGALIILGLITIVRWILASRDSGWSPALEGDHEDWKKEGEEEWRAVGGGFHL